jgi:hypothetical protein
MGKGSRNRLNRENQPKKEARKIKAWKKPMPAAAKKVIAGAICLLIVASIVLGSMANDGVFKRGNILVESKTGKFDLNQQMATYLVWDTLCYWGEQLYSYNYGGGAGSSYNTQYQAVTYGLQFAKKEIRERLFTSLDSYKDLLREYVAVCDYAVTEMGIVLSDEEKKAAEENAENYLNTMALYYTGLNLRGFMTDYIGHGVQMKDVKKVAVMQALYQKAYEQKQAEVEAYLEANNENALLFQFVQDNPEAFYTTDYLTYHIEAKKGEDDEALRDKLLEAGSAETFKTVLLENLYNESANNFKAIFNKYAIDLNGEADTILEAIKDQTDVGTLQGLLAANGMEAVQYAKNDTTLNDEVIAWLFAEDRKACDTTVIKTGTGIYVVAVTVAPAEDKVTAAIKSYLSLPTIAETLAVDLAAAKAEDAGAEVEGKTLSQLIAENGMTVQDVATNDETMNEDLKSFIKKATKAKESTTYYTDEAIYVVVLVEAPVDVTPAAPAEGETAPDPYRTAKIAIKSFAKASGESYRGDDDFKNNLFLSLKEAFELNKDSEGLTLYNKTEDKTIAKMLADFETAAKKILPTTKTAKFVRQDEGETEAPYEEGSYLEWMFKGVGAQFQSPVPAGATKNIDKKGDEDEVLGYDVYIIVDPMKLDTELVINGGYMKYSNIAAAEGVTPKTAREQAAALITELEALGEKTETTLGTKFGGLTGATVSAQIMQDSIDNDALEAWFASADRKACEYATVHSPDTDPDDGKDDEAVFVAYFIERHLAWQLDARDGYISEQISDWVKTLREGYEVKGIDKIKDKKPITTTAAA